MKDNPKSMIFGTGSSVPDKVLTNFDLEKIVDTTDEWIRERSGIERRHILEEDKTNSDMATEASKIALGAFSLSQGLEARTIIADIPSRFARKVHSKHPKSPFLSEPDGDFPYIF